MVLIIFMFNIIIINNTKVYGLSTPRQQTEVYAGMIIGLNTREEDIEINVCKEKKQTNVRAASADFATILTPPTVFSLEQSLDFLEDDELLEVTPISLRLRKKILNSTERSKARK